MSRLLWVSIASLAIACGSSGGSTGAVKDASAPDTAVEAGGSEGGPLDGGDAGELDAADGGIPPACGSLELGAGSLYTSGALHGLAVTVTNQESTITPTDFNSVPAGSPLCVQGTVANPPQGYGYAELALGVDEEALRASLPVDAGTDAAADAGTTSYESNSIVPTSDGLVVHVRNAGNSPLSLCLDGANDDTWCVTDLSQGPFFPWSSFRDNFGSGAVAYDRQPIVIIYLNASVAGSAASTPFAFCLDNLAEAASWCGCMGDACACPMGTTACNATCVLDTAINPSDCGACGTVCSSTSACSAGQCQNTIVSGPSNPYSIALDANNVYFTDLQAGAVLMAARGGGAPVPIASGQSLPFVIAVDATSVYWANQGTAANNFSDGTIMKAPLGGGTPVTLASGQTDLEALAVDATSVYWANQGTAANNFSDGTIMKVALGGGTPVTLAAGQLAIGFLAVDGTSIYWTDQGTATSGSFNADGSVMKLALSGGDGGTPTILASGQVGPFPITVDGTSVYWGTTGTIAKVPLGGGDTVVLASGQSFPFGIAVDGTDVYWTNAYGGSVVKVPLAGGSPVTIASGQNNALFIALDATNVYFTTEGVAGAGAIVRVAK